MEKPRKKLLTGAIVLAGLTALGFYALLSSPKGTNVTLASTTSTENSGLLGYLLPIFKGESGIEFGWWPLAPGRPCAWR